MTDRPWDQVIFAWDGTAALRYRGDAEPWPLLREEAAAFAEAQGLDRTVSLTWVYEGGSWQPRDLVPTTAL